MFCMDKDVSFLIERSDEDGMQLKRCLLERAFPSRADGSFGYSRRSMVDQKRDLVVQ